MKFVDEYRREEDAGKLVRAIHRLVTRPWVIMEVCGGQTHTILKSGIDRLLPPEVTVVHGPGCPVCVTPLELIDKAIALARTPGVIFTSFGDMFRAPANAMAVWQARQMGVRNFSILCAQVRVPPAIELILNDPYNMVQGFLAAGHVCTVMGYWEYEPIAERYRVPIVVTGFEPLDLLQGIYMVLKALEEGRWGVENQYARSVRREGNVQAQKLMNEVFQICDRQWRGIGLVRGGGLCLRPEYSDFDAERRFGLQDMTVAESAVCIAGEILQGKKKPYECPAFGGDCTPEHPLGAPMVSSEGACAAYYQYGRGK